MANLNIVVHDNEQKAESKQVKKAAKNPESKPEKVKQDGQVFARQQP